MFQWIRTAATWLVNSAVSGIEKPAAWFLNVITGGQSDSGIRVTAKSALSYPPVWYAISKITGSIIQMPLTPYKRLDRGSEKDTTIDAYRLLKTRPNPYQSAAQFMETLVVHALLFGNGKAAIIRRNRKVAELIIIPANCSTTVYVDGRKVHTVRISNKNDRLVTEGDWSKAADVYVIPDEDVLHIPGLGIDGVNGLEMFDVAKNPIGLGLAAEKAANKDFANGSRPDFLIETPKSMFRDDKDAQEFINNLNEYHKGLDNKGRVGMLREGMKAVTLASSSEASLWIEQRKFQRQEIALLFLLESILGDDESVSYNSLEQKNLAALSNLMRWLVKIEQECDEKLLTKRQKTNDTHFFKFNTAVLLRSDFKTTIGALSKAIEARILSPNEAREKLDMNPYDGGDEYANPVITPGKAGGESEGSNSDDDANAESPDDKNRRTVVAHFRHVFEGEARKVLAAAGNQGNYIAWVDKFYEHKCCETMKRHFSAMGGSDQHAIDHCEKSKNELLEVAGTVTPDGLADAVSATVEKWPDRAEAMADLILNGELIDA